MLNGFQSPVYKEDYSSYTDIITSFMEKNTLEGFTPQRITYTLNVFQMICGRERVALFLSSNKVIQPLGTSGQCILHCLFRKKNDNIYNNIHIAFINTVSHKVQLVLRYNNLYLSTLA